MQNHVCHMLPPFFSHLFRRSCGLGDLHKASSSEYSSGQETCYFLLQYSVNMLPQLFFSLFPDQTVHTVVNTWIIITKEDSRKEGSAANTLASTDSPPPLHIFHSHFNQPTGHKWDLSGTKLEQEGEGWMGTKITKSRGYVPQKKRGSQLLVLFPPTNVSSKWKMRKESLFLVWIHEIKYDIYDIRSTRTFWYVSIIILSTSNPALWNSLLYFVYQKYLIYPRGKLLSAHQLSTVSKVMVCCDYPVMPPLFVYLRNRLKGTLKTAQTSVNKYM